MPTLYYLPGSLAMAAHAALEEASADYELVRCIREDGVTVFPSNYLEINPHGRVPAYVDGDLRMYESAAIVMVVGDRFPKSAVLPPPGSDERALCLRWLVHLTNTVQPHFAAAFAPQRVVGDDEAAKAAAGTAGKASLAGAFDWLDGELAGKRYLLGDTFCGADLFLWMVTRVGRRLEPKAWDRPNLGAHYRLLSERPSVRRMMEQQELEAYPSD